jgi:hypothetical protein
MIQIALDWNCVIDLEEDRLAAPYLRHILAWRDQGIVHLCMAGAHRLENPRSWDVPTINQETWEEKLRNVGLAGIELREAKSRFGIQLDRWVMEEMQNRLSPGTDFLFYVYCARSGVDPIDRRRHPTLDAVYQEVEDDQKYVLRKWTNDKCDALSLYTYSTWAGPDDLFVTSDDRDFIRRRGRLREPYRIERWVWAPPPGQTRPFLEPVELTLQLTNIEIKDLSQGHIMTPQEAVEHLQARFGAEKLTA